MLKEQELYGSSRLGTYQRNVEVENLGEQLMMGEGSYIWGSRFFELSNHLGNVLATIQDRMTVTNASGVDYFDPVVVSAQDYYAFGMMMPGRTYSAPGGGYRYGFNGKENDNEVKGTGNQQDYGMRIYDPRLARFLSVDPISRTYPMLTPYQFASNRPIDGIDLDGKEWSVATTTTTNNDGYLVTETVYTLKVRVVNQSAIISGLSNISTIANNIKKAIESDFNFTTIDDDSKEIKIYKTNVVLDFTPLGKNETPTVDNGFWMVLEDKKTEVRDNGDEVLVAGSTLPGYIPGRTQKNIIHVGVTKDEVALEPIHYERTGSHESGHSGGLPHPWMTFESKSLNIYDATQYNEKGKLDKNNKSNVFKNLMNSNENPNSSMSNSKGRMVTEGQLESMKRTIQKQQPKL